MPTYTACLIDVFDTVLSVDFPRYRTSLADHAGVDADEFATAIEPWTHSVTLGSTTIESAFREVLQACGGPAAGELVHQLVTTDRELLHDLTFVHEDTVPFLTSLRDKGVRTAFVSNCAENTRPLLDQLGLIDMVDELVLSCEVGAAKPDRVIYEAALGRLGATADETVFVDDQPTFCDAAAALGIRAVLIDRFNGAGTTSDLTELAVYF